MAYISVDIDLDEFDDDDILREAKRRFGVIKGQPGLLGDKVIDNLKDTLKYEFIIENFDNITLEQLESLVK